VPYAWNIHRGGCGGYGDGWRCSGAGGRLSSSGCGAGGRSCGYGVCSRAGCSRLCASARGDRVCSVAGRGFICGGSGGGQLCAGCGDSHLLFGPADDEFLRSGGQLLRSDDFLLRCDDGLLRSNDVVLRSDDILLRPDNGVLRTNGRGVCSHRCWISGGLRTRDRWTAATVRTRRTSAEYAEVHRALRLGVAGFQTPWLKRSRVASRCRAGLAKVLFVAIASGAWPVALTSILRRLHQAVTFSIRLRLSTEVSARYRPPMSGCGNFAFLVTLALC